MSPIKQCEEPTLISYCFLSKTKLSIVLDITQEIILEFVLRSAEIYPAREKQSKTEEQFLSSSGRKYRNVSKGNRLRAPYKNRNNEINVHPNHP